MRNFRRVFVFGVLASMLATACNSGGGHGGVLIVVDGQGLTAAQLASVTDVWIYIDGDGDGTRVTFDFKQKMGLPTGMYQTKYQPKNHAGKLTITGELHHTDPAMMVDQIIATNLTIVDIRMGNQVMATIMLVGSSGAGGAGGAGGATSAGGAGSSLPGSAGAGGAVTAGGVGGSGNAGGGIGTGGGGGSGGSGATGACAAAACSLLVADGCCPSFCTGATDVDCALCGNGVVEKGETCDPLTTCPSACSPKGCQLFIVANAGTCQAACTAAGLQTQCVNADGCCPAGCTSATDSDCQPGCGNGVLEGTETCDVAPAGVLCSAITCDDKDACTVDSRQGMDSTCNIACGHSQITGCVPGVRDGCCASGCNATNDPDCAVVCGNGVVESPTESCDTGLTGSCPTACPQAACVLPDLLNAGTCKAACVDQGRRQTACVLAAKDGCCPAGCNATNDSDCVAVCGNGVLESGETCESTPATPLCTNVSCDDKNACTSDPSTGSAATCTLACGPHVAITACSLTSDGCCPSGCTGVTDADCPPSNDTCAGAVDITAGGDFAFSLVGAKTDLTQIKCGGTLGEVFFTFTLPTYPVLSTNGAALSPIYFGYFDVYDPAGNAVNVSLELYQAACPASGSNPVDCAATTSGQTGCTTTQVWPRMTDNLTSGTPYTLAARLASGTAGRYTLRFHRVPAICASAGAFPASGTTVDAGNSCGAVQYGFSCAPSNTTVTGQQTYYVAKCPAAGLNVETCYRQNEFLDTIVQVNRGSVNYNSTTGQCTLASTTAQVCDDMPTSCSWATTDATLSGVEKGERGIFTVNVGSFNNPNCTSIMLGNPSP